MRGRKKIWFDTKQKAFSAAILTRSLLSYHQCFTSRKTESHVLRRRDMHRQRLAININGYIAGCRHFGKNLRPDLYHVFTDLWLGLDKEPISATGALWWGGVGIRIRNACWYAFFSSSFSLGDTLIVRLILSRNNYVERKKKRKRHATYVYKKTDATFALSLPLGQFL